MSAIYKEGIEYGGGSTDYNDLSNKPKVGGVELSGNQTISQLGGVQNFNGRIGSVLPMAGDYSAEQVNYDSNQTVKQKIDALVTKEASDIAGQQSLLKDTVGWTGKNLLKNTATSRTVNGVTFTVNADGSVTANGQATANASVTIATYLTLPTEIIGQNVILTGCPEGGSTDGKYFMNAIGFRSASSGDTDTGNGVQINNVYDFTANTATKVYIEVRSGYNAQNLTFYPMLRKADIIDPTYEPYHESVETMYEEEIHGVNLFSNSISGLATSGGTIGTTNFALVEGATAFYGKVQRNKNYTITKAGGDRFRVCLSNEVPANRVPCNIIANADGNSYTFNSGNYDYVYLLASMTSQTIDVIKPMLRKADIDDSTYRPYNYQAIQNQLNAQGVMGAKNFLCNYAPAAVTSNGITWTRDENGVITANGTTTDASYYELWSQNPRVSEGYKNLLDLSQTYILNGNSQVWSDEWYVSLFMRVHLTDNSDRYFFDNGNGVVINLSQFNNIGYITMYCRVGYTQHGAQTVSNYKIRPMLRLASDPDDTYQPYAMTNRELTEEVSNIEGDILDILNGTNLTSADNLNNIRTAGLYKWSTSIPTNAPVFGDGTSNWCALRVLYTGGTAPTQICIHGGWRNSSNHIAIRGYGGEPNQWSSWKYIASV